MTGSESESSSLPRFSRRVPEFLSPVSPSPSVRASKLLKSYHERRHDLQHLQSYHERRHDPSLARVGIREANCVCSSKSQPASFVFGHRTLADPQQISLLRQEVSLATLARPRHWERQAPEHWRGTTGSRTSRLCLPGTTEHWNAVAPESHDLIEREKGASQ